MHSSSPPSVAIASSSSESFKLSPSARRTSPSSDLEIFPFPSLSKTLKLAVSSFTSTAEGSSAGEGDRSSIRPEPRGVSLYTTQEAAVSTGGCIEISCLDAAGIRWMQSRRWFGRSEQLPFHAT